MYCKYCGKEIDDHADVCIHCGRSTGNNNQQSTNTMGVPKTGVGVLCGLFLGIIGLIIGILLYPYNTIERDTFIKGWVGTVLSVVVLVVVVIAISDVK